MIRRYLSKIKQTLTYAYFKYLKKKRNYTEPLKLHLGCGSVYLKDYVNIDVTSDSIADIVSDFQDIYKLYPENSVSEILMVHSISYLRLWEGIDFFKNCFQLLEEGGSLIMEFPDLEKCAAHLVNHKNDYPNYIEAVRAIYAFDLHQIESKDEFFTYRFGWSAWHINKELKHIGFSVIKAENPQTHGRRIWRDTRIIAIK
ncbi:MAG: hypothetical protein HQ521_18035 [Bacteroidetes bacterium]|nr:hypothetical protein [Bacteroidota bacterium]